jgi:hypothetical protein
MRVRALLVLLVSAVAVLLPVAVAGPATAGGPTSVLMSSPALGRTSSLYTDDAGYQALADYVSAFESGTGRTGVPTAHAVGNGITLTWLIHDVSVWRVDRIYIDAMSGPWIATQEAVGDTPDIWSAPVRWHRSDQPKALVALLAAHGLTDGSALPSGTVSDVTAGADVVAGSGESTGSDESTGSGADEPVRAAEPAVPTGPAGLAPWVALVVGLLVGAGATAGGALVLARRRERNADGHDPVPEWADGDLLTSAR